MVVQVSGAGAKTLVRRKVLIYCREEKIDYENFEKIFRKIKEKSEIEKQIGEEHLLKVASNGSSLWRGNTKVIVKNDKEELEISINQLLLTRLWVHSLSGAIAIDNEEELTKGYLLNGGNVAYKDVVEPVCCFKFFAAPDVAREHNRFFKNLLDAVPSENFLFEIDEFGDKKIINDAREIARNKQQYLNFAASYNYQRYATGLPGMPFRLIGFLQRDNDKFSIKRVLQWEWLIKEKIDRLNELGLPMQEMIGIFSANRTTFAILRESGEALSKMLQQVDKESASRLLYSLGALLRKMHDNGVGHEKPDEMQARLENGDTKIVASSYEDIWLNDNKVPLSDEDRAAGLMRIEAILKEQEKEELLSHFAQGYGLAEFEKIKKGARE